MLKKIIAVLMIFTMVSVMFISVVYGAEKNTAKAYEGTPTIDADVDAVWSNAPAITYFYQTGEPVMHIATDIKPTIRFMWDEKNLYVLVQVKDKGVYGDAPGGETEWVTSISNNDGFELYLDTDNEKAILYQPDDRNIKFDYRGKHWVIQGPSTGIVAKGKKTSDGYIIETSVAWTKTRKAGDIVGIDFCVNDNQDGKSGRASWVSWLSVGNSWQSPSSTGNLELIATAKSTPASAGSAASSENTAANSESTTNAGNTETTANNPVTGDNDVYFPLVILVLALVSMTVLFKKKSIACR